MLEKLAGPFNRLLPDSSAAPASQDTFWDDRLGLACWNGGYGYYVTQLDGKTHLRARPFSMGRFIIDETTSGWAQTTTTESAAYPFDHASGTRSGPAIWSGGAGTTSDIAVRLPDRLLRVVRYNDYLEANWRPSDLSADWDYEAVGDIGGTGGGLPVWSRAGRAGLYWLVMPSDGRAIMYDATAREFLGAVSFLPANTGAWYSPRLGVFVVLASGQVSVYATAPLPTTVAAPTGSPVRGRLVTVTTRVTGSNGEGCPDELVDWALTAGSGEMVGAQSTTDANGYATAQYLGPMSGGTNPTIRAQVKC